MKETVYICTECGFYGTARKFHRHVIWPEYNSGHGNAEPEDSVLKCPECGTFQEEDIEEARPCQACSEYFPSETLRKDGDELICEGCLSLRNLYDITKKGDTNE